MSLSLSITDNASELLVKIMEFTRARCKLLTRNITLMHSPDFVPLDLTVDEFSSLLDEAIDEHVRSHRLMLRDTENIKFGAQGSFTIKPVHDDYAKELLEEDCDAYLRLQMNKLLENGLNHRLAAQLLRHKQGMISVHE
jgi:flagellar basal body rod protein FlgB